MRMSHPTHREDRASTEDVIEAMTIPGLQRELSLDVGRKLRAWVGS